MAFFAGESVLAGQKNGGFKEKKKKPKHEALSLVEPSEATAEQIVVFFSNKNSDDPATIIS